MNRQLHFISILLWSTSFVSGCSAEAAPAIEASAIVETSEPRQTEEEVVAEPAPLPDLDQDPLYWFAPLPPLSVGPGRPYTGSDDFMDLFTAGADWERASGNIQVFKLYGEWVAYSASDAQLKQAIKDIRRRGLALAVEAGPLTATPDCGEGIEGFAGVDEGRNIAERILRAGGQIDLIALDEPYYYAHFYDGPNACRWPSEDIAAEVGQYIEIMREYFPDLRVGDTEPTPLPLEAEDYTEWLLSFRAVNGYDLDFLHIDVDWARVEWPRMVKNIEDFGREESIPIGIIYTGNSGDHSDESWLSIAGERVKRYEIGESGSPAHVLFQSWNDHPDFVLPETGDFTFTSFIRIYFEDKEALGFQADALLANLALFKDTRGSRFVPGNEMEMAVDGDSGTLWSSGGFPTQWIEIDIGEAVDIGEMRLIPSQFPAGETTHRIYGRGPGTANEFVLLETIQGMTSDGQLITINPVDPWLEIQFIRVESIQSPSWVAWYEIEILRVED